MTTYLQNDQVKYTALLSSVIIEVRHCILTVLGLYCVIRSIYLD